MPGVGASERPTARCYTPAPTPSVFAPFGRAGDPARDGPHRESPGSSPIADPQIPPVAPEAPATGDPTRWSLLEGTTLAILAALASVTVNGYRFGDSNHGITVPLLKRAIDPSLYPGDPMVATGESFPTLFYRLLAWLLPGTDAVPVAFFALYVVAIAATFAGAWRIGRWAGGPVAGFLTAAFVFPVRIGLAGESLYRVAFSHSHLASALSIWAIAWFLEGRRLLPLLVLSLGAYNHVLYSAYVLVPMFLVVLLEAPRVGRSATLRRIAAATLPLLPLLVWAAVHSTPMTAEWLEQLRLRSAHHSFPSTFGDALPAAAAMLALGALSASRLSEDRRRLAAAFFVGTALLFVLGSLMIEWVPVKAVLLLQPHRSWRFLLLLLDALIAAMVVAGWREGGWGRAVSAATATAVLVPGMEPLLPLAVALQAAFGLPRAPAWARITAATVLVGLGGWGAASPEYALFFDRSVNRWLSDSAVAALGLAIVLATARELRPALRGATAILVAALTLPLANRCFDEASVRWESDPYVEVQRWARASTPRDAVFMTPPQRAGFRVFSERTIVGEWKDGTQQYFDPSFSDEWLSRMEALQGVDGESPYWRLDDDQLLSKAYDFRVTHVVVPRRAEREGLVEVFRNASFIVYEARRSAASG